MSDESDVVATARKIFGVEVGDEIAASVSSEQEVIELAKKLNDLGKTERTTKSSARNIYTLTPFERQEIHEYYRARKQSAGVQSRRISPELKELFDKLLRASQTRDGERTTTVEQVSMQFTDSKPRNGR